MHFSVFLSLSYLHLHTMLDYGQPNTITDSLALIYPAGRDRTGVLAAILLALCRTPRALIACDYLLPRVGIEPHRVYLFQNFFRISVSSASAAEATRGIKKEKAAGLQEMCEVHESSKLAFPD